MKPFRKLTPAQTEKTFPSRWRRVNRGRWVNQVNELRAEVELQTGLAEARQNDIDGLMNDIDDLMAESQSSREAMRRARFKIDELRAENERLRAALTEIMQGARSVKRLKEAVVDIGLAHIAAQSAACPRCGYDRTQEP